MNKLLPVVIGLVIGAMGTFAYMISRMHATHTVTYRLAGQQGCRVRVNYAANDMGGATPAEGLLPWELSATLAGGDVASITHVEVLAGGEACRPTCTILVDGAQAFATNAPTCQIVVGRFW
jgi:hypothetical protein